MNLSSYLQMPPAPSGPTSTSTSTTAPQGARAGAGLTAGADLGFDFAQVMARQMARLVPQERQTFAADVPKAPAQDTSAHQRHPQPIEDHDSSPRTPNSASQDEPSDRTSEAQARPRNKHITSKNQRTDDTDALLESLMQGAPTLRTHKTLPDVAASATANQPLAPQDAHELAASGKEGALQTIALSPQVNIITDPKQAPSPESLAAFAQSMGLSASEIQNLLNQPPANAGSALAASTGQPNGLLQMPPHSVQAAMNTWLQGTPQGAAPGVDATMATQLAAISGLEAQAAPVVSGQGLAVAATTLLAPSQPGLTPTDMANIQQLQITVLPAAVLPINAPAINTPMPSTLDMLSLLGTGIDEKDVGALLSRFSEDSAGSEGQADQSPAHGEDNHFSSFAQTLTRSSNTSNAPATAQATTINMGEVYDQLSDKMATELAARMHKQLSDGEWKMKFGLRPSNLGGVEIQLEMKDGKLDAVFRADNPLTRDLLQNSSQRLREALGNFGINAGQVQVGQGGSHAQQNSSGNSAKHSQVRDNSPSQVNGTESASGASPARSKANASLLDLYA